jgi:hypothetical protein
MSLPLLRSVATAETYYLINGNAYSQSDWNEAQNDRAWTRDGSSFEAASAEGEYSTNGHRLMAGHSDPAAPEEVQVFRGHTLRLEADRSVDQMPGGDSPGMLFFDLRPGLDPEATGRYAADIVVASAGARLIGDAGTIELGGTLKLTDRLELRTYSDVEFMSFTVAAPVTGQGNIALRGGAAGTPIGGITWVLDDVSGWEGFEIAVFDNNTLAFGRATDLRRPGRPRGIRLKDGFLDLRHDIHVGSGQFRLENSRNEGVTLADGIWTTQRLNQRGFGEVAKGTGRLLIGQDPVAAPETGEEPS